MRRDEVLHIARAAARIAGGELVFPYGWQGRLLHLVADDDGEVEIRAYFPEVHDLCAAKLGAGVTYPNTGRPATEVAGLLAQTLS